MDSIGVPQGSGSQAIGTPNGSSFGERGSERGRLSPPSLLRDPVCGPQQVSETTDRRGECGKNILLKDLNNEKSLLWFWESSPPQLTLQSSVEFNKEETNNCINKSSFINNSESSFVLPEEEQPKANIEPAYGTLHSCVFIFPEPSH